MSVESSEAGGSQHWHWRSPAGAVLLAAILLVVGLLLWQLSFVLLLIFGAILVAILLRGIAGLIRRWLPVSEGASVAIAGLSLAVLLVGFFVLLGSQLRAQVTDLIEGLPDRISTVEERLGMSGLDDWLVERARDLAGSGDLAGSLTDISSIVVGGLGHAVLVIVAGVYLAVDPRLYRQGMLLLFPERRRGKAAETLAAIGRALKLWLLGQLVAMVLVGTLTTLGLWLLGVESALALGFMAGLLEFVPFLGPVLSAVPAIALGLADGPSTALWVTGLYILIQQIEGSVITPLVQQRTVDLPPALTIFAIVAFGILFGPLGILLATPLSVVCFVLIKLLWVRDALHEDTDLPGEP